MHLLSTLYTMLLNMCLLRSNRQIDVGEHVARRDGNVHDAEKSAHHIGEGIIAIEHEGVTRGGRDQAKSVGTRSAHFIGGV